MAHPHPNPNQVAHPHPNPNQVAPPALLELLAANVDANRLLLPEAVCLEVAQLEWGT